MWTDWLKSDQKLAIWSLKPQFAMLNCTLQSFSFISISRTNLLESQSQLVFPAGFIIGCVGSEIYSLFMLENCKQMRVCCRRNERGGRLLSTTWGCIPSQRESVHCRSTVWRRGSRYRTERRSSRIVKLYVTGLHAPVLIGSHALLPQDVCIPDLIKLLDILGDNGVIDVTRASWLIWMKRMQMLIHAISFFFLSEFKEWGTSGHYSG